MNDIIDDLELILAWLATPDNVPANIRSAAERIEDYLAVNEIHL